MSDFESILRGNRYDEERLALTHPEQHRNPSPLPRYNLVVIGAGTGGLISALVASSLGAKVALVERALMGGDCLNYGCVPSKALLRCAKEAAARRDGRFGFPAGEPQVDWAGVSGWVRGAIAAIAPANPA